MKLKNNEKRIITVLVGIWGIFLILSGLLMNKQVKPVIKYNYKVSYEKRKIAQAQAKTNEIRLKDITIEINNPISVDIKDYLENADKLNEDILNALKLDTSLVNINEAGTYQYTITYKKKKYVGNVIVKKKELPNMTLTLKTITLKIGETLSSNPRTFINEEISDEVYNNLTLDISKVDTTKQQDYEYYITYKGVTYQGKVEVRAPGPTVIPPKAESDDITCPSDAVSQNNTCICTDQEKEYNKETKTCIKKEA